MNFEEFRKLHDGHYLEVAGTSNAQNQCVDLVNGYIRDVLGLPIIEWTNAVDFPSKAGNKYQYILNTPEAVPKYGDIIVWKPSPGHIAVFIEGDIKRFSSFDQNFPLNSVCHTQEHTYTNVIGWLRYTPPVVTTVPMATLPQAELDKLRADRDLNYTNWQSSLLKGSQLTLQLQEVQDQLKQCQSAPPPSSPVPPPVVVTPTVTDYKPLVTAISNVLNKPNPWYWAFVQDERINDAKTLIAQVGA